MLPKQTFIKSCFNVPAGDKQTLTIVGICQKVQRQHQHKRNIFEKKFDLRIKKVFIKFNILK
jgi:hypothetical protein